MIRGWVFYLINSVGFDKDNILIVLAAAITAAQTAAKNNQFGAN